MVTAASAWSCGFRRAVLCPVVEQVPAQSKWPLAAFIGSRPTLGFVKQHVCEGGCRLDGVVALIDKREKNRGMIGSRRPKLRPVD